MKEHSVDLMIELRWFLETDVENFRDFVWKLVEATMGEMKKHLFQVVSQTCDAVGSSVEVGNKDFWEAHIELLEGMHIRFDEEGNHNYRLYGHPDQKKKVGTPTQEQEQRIEEIFKRKRDEFYAQKRTRRLS